jgi:hypothetical protein
MTKRMRGALASFVGLGLMLLPHLSHAQATTGSINGTVTDNTGAVVPNAAVTVIDEGKGISSTVQSNASGEFLVTHLIPDEYTVKVTATGFETFQEQHIRVDADASPKVDAKLQVGGASQTVQVNADQVAQLKTDRAEVSTTFEARTVDNLPVPNRNFTNLELLLPGAQMLGWGHATDENPQASAQIQIDGQAFGGVAYELDGTDNQDPILGIIVINPDLDSISESKIATQNYDAEFGKAVAAVVTVQTKSGSNNFHGAAYDYRQSNATLARDPFTQNPAAGTDSTSGLVPPGLYNQFGGSLGGPVKKDKAFFFGDYQGLRQKVGVSAGATVPSQHLIATCLGQAPTATGVPGCDFSEYLAAGAVGPAATAAIYNPLTGAPFPGGVIPASFVSPQALNLFKLLQPYAPNRGGTYGLLSGGNFTTSGTGIFNTDLWTVRGDYQVTASTHAFVRFSRFTSTETGGTMFGPAGGLGFGLLNYGGSSHGANDSLAAGVDLALNPTLLTDFRIGYYRYNIATQKYDQSTQFATQLGIPGMNLGNYYTSGAPGFIVADVGSFGNFTTQPSTAAQYGSGLNINRCNCPLTEREDQGQVVNNWTKILGNHSIKFGADLRYARNLRVPSDNNRTGLINFGNGPTSGGTSGGLGFATLALGDVTFYNRYVSISTNAKEFQKRTFFYAQDTWRATSNLTINAGLRYELYWPETVNGVEHGSDGDFYAGYLHVAGVGGIPSNMGWSPAWKALAPRLGVAYQIDPKTVIRAGYGRSFDIGVFGSIFGHNVTQNIPVLANQSVSPTGGTTSYAFNLAQGPPAYAFPAVPANGLLANPGWAVNSKFRPNPLRLPTIDAWNLSIQRSLNPTLSVTMAYVGNKGTHTLGAGDSNTTNPNEPGIFLPSGFSTTGRTLHFIGDPSQEPGQVANAAGIYPDGGTNNQTLLRRYYAGSLPACSSPGYAPPSLAGAPLAAGQCGWTQDQSYYSDNLDSHYNALQITVDKQVSRGLSATVNYSWQRAFAWNPGYSTWDRAAVKGRDPNIREQQLTAYGVWQMPFGKNQMIGANVPGYLNEVIGGWSLNPMINWMSGLPYTLSFSECGSLITSDAPCYPNGRAGSLQTHPQKYDPVNHTVLDYVGASVPLTQQPFSGFTAPGLDQIGNSGLNNKFGPNFFDTDLALEKNFPIHESLFAQFRVDAYNAFNHMSLGNPGGNIDAGPQYIGGLAPAPFQTRQLQFSLRVQF